MKRHVIRAFSGVNKSVSRRLLPDHMVGDVKNVIFDDGTSKRRAGYSKLGDNLPLYGDLVNFFFFEKMSTTASYLLAITTRDVYYYSGGSWINITPRFATNTYGGVTGTAHTVTNSGATVTVSVADWLAGETGNDGGTWLIAEDQANSGNPDQSGMTWYEISDITSTTQLTLAGSSFPTWGAGTDYILRKCFQGSEASYENITDYQVVILSSADNAVVFTNGLDNVYYFQDSTNTPTLEHLSGGTTDDLTNVTTGAAIWTAELVEYFNDVTFIANLTSSAGDKFPTDLMWCEQGDPTDWTDSDLTSGTVRLTRDQSDITRMITFKNRLYVFKENSITEVSISSDTFNPFLFNEERVTGTGCISGRSVQLIEGNFVVFLGNDNVYAFDGINIKTVGDAISKYIFSNINFSMAAAFTSATMKEKGLYLLFVVENPSTAINKCYVLDYKQNSWTIWEFAASMTGMGEYVSDTAEAWSDVAAGITVASIAGSWSDSTTTADATLPIMGDNAGNVYLYDEDADDDNGTDIDTLLDTSDYDADDPKNAKHWKETTITAGVESAGSVRIRVSPDFSTNWSDWTVVALTGAGLTQTLTQNWRQRGKQLRVQIENIDGAYFEMEDLILGFSGGGIKTER